MEERIDITTPDGVLQALVVRPAIEPAPVIVVIHELFGVNDDIKATCRELAAQGYIAVAPDLFWRQEPGFSRSQWTPADFDKAVALYRAFDFDKGPADIAAVIAQSKTLSGASGKVGVMGFCMGGLLTYLAATQRGADAAVAYYGGGTEQHLDEAAAIATPLLMHLADRDEYMPPQAQAAIQEALADNPKVTIHTYAGCGHAFARHGGEAYDASATSLAAERTRTFLAQRLWL
jgi:carboxymethylenebutenolidase